MRGAILLVMLLVVLAAWTLVGALTGYLIGMLAGYEGPVLFAIGSVSGSIYGAWRIDRVLRRE